MNKILIIDDHLQLLDFLKILFSLEGYKVLAIHKVADVEHQLQQFRPDLMLMDIQLGDGDGRIICDRIKKKQLVNSFPIILITALSYQEISKIDTLADAVIGKPWDITTLLQTARQLITLYSTKIS